MTTLLTMTETPPILKIYQAPNIMWQILVAICTLTMFRSARNTIIGQHRCSRLKDRLPLGGCEWNISRLQRGIATANHQRATRCNMQKGNMMLLKKRPALHRVRPKVLCATQSSDDNLDSDSIYVISSARCFVGSAAALARL